MIPNIDIYKRAAASLSQDKYHRRALWHNYKSRCIYMITLKKMPGVPSFCKIEGQITCGRATAKSINTNIGAILCKALREMPTLFPEIRLLQYIIMPDHVHLLLEATQNLNYHIADAIRTYKQICSRFYADALLCKYNYCFSGHVFADGYHDRILSGKDQLSNLIAYIRDNPRRLFLKQKYPEAFRNRLILSFKDLELSIYGNPLLLEHPAKYAVRFSSKFSQEKISAKRKIWEEAIRNGSVLISPFIHPSEKEFLEKAITCDGKAIIIQENGFPERWKPEKRLFEACAQGRLLFIGQKEYTTRRSDLSRATCMRLNSITETLTAITPGSYTLRHR